MMDARRMLRSLLLVGLLVGVSALPQAHAQLAHTRSTAAIFALASPGATSALVTPENLRTHIAQIQGVRNTWGTPAQIANLAAVSAYIHNLLTNDGLSVTEDPVTYAEQQPFPNIVGTLTGTMCPEKTFIVGAHYDGAQNTPGADDNASGVAAMLEIARLLSSQSFPASIDFVAFSFEEAGMVGSRQMAAKAKATGRELIGMYSLEMVGYTCHEPGCQSSSMDPGATDLIGDFILAAGNTASAPLLGHFTHAAAASVPNLKVFPLEAPGNGETIDRLRLSDHSPFWDQGYQALLITDTANLRNPNYHRPSDTLDTLDLGFSADVANAAAASVVETVTIDADADGTPDVCETTGPPRPTYTPTRTPVRESTATPTRAPGVGGMVRLPPMSDAEAPLQAQGSWTAKDFVVIGAAAGFVLLLAGGAWAVKRRGDGW